MSDSSEEKSEDATPKKLDDARKKGQVAGAKDFVSAVTLLFSTGFLLLFSERVTGMLGQSIVLAIEMPWDDPVWAMGRVADRLVQASLLIMLPILLLTVAGAVLATAAVNKGFVFSLEPMIPKFEKINPVEGIKRIFKARTLVELAKSLLKTLLLGATFALVVLGALSSLVNVPFCGGHCVTPLLMRLSTTIIAIGLVFTLVVGAIDILIQRALFLQDQKMTKTDVKRENKDTQGTPEIKQEQHRLRQEASQDAPLGLKSATVVVFGPGATVALRYVPGETGVPIVVARGDAEGSGPLMAEAYGQQKAMVEDPALARDLLASVRLGKPVEAQHYDAVARVLQAAGP